MEGCRKTPNELSGIDVFALLSSDEESRSCAPSPPPAELRSERATSAASLVSIRPSRT